MDISASICLEIVVGLGGLSEQARERKDFACRTIETLARCVPKGSPNARRLNEASAPTE